VCIDSSVAFKWFCADDESAVDEALRLLRQHRDGEIELVAPAHMPAEVLNGLHSRKLTPPEMAVAARALGGIGITYADWTTELLSESASLAARHRLTINDALFPALASLLDCELVTADRAHARATECPVRLIR